MQIVKLFAKIKQINFNSPHSLRKSKQSCTRIASPRIALQFAQAAHISEIKTEVRDTRAGCEMCRLRA